MTRILLIPFYPFALIGALVLLFVAGVLLTVADALGPEVDVPEWARYPTEHHLFCSLRDRPVKECSFCRRMYDEDVPGWVERRV